MLIAELPCTQTGAARVEVGQAPNICHRILGVRRHSVWAIHCQQPCHWMMARAAAVLQTDWGGTRTAPCTGWFMAVVHRYILSTGPLGKDALWWLWTLGPKTSMLGLVVTRHKAPEWK